MSLDRSKQAPWWRDATVYQVYVRSFADADGDGVGDLPGITARLPHLADLGVDAVWLTPFYRSPQHDHGYDVADYRDVDPLFGDLGDAERLVEAAHGLGLRVIVDLVPNHTSSEHAWFRAAVAAGPGSPERARYHFRPWSPEPPNNWRSVFGGAAWSRVDDGSEQPEWYLHLFDSTQPDLDWQHPEVGDMFVDVLRFWLDRGVDGFRVDVAHGLIKAAGLPDHDDPDLPAPGRDDSMVARDRADEPMWDQPGVHDVYRRWHEVLAAYGGDRMMVAEAWTPDAESMSRYVRADEFQQAFNFAWLLAPWSASSFADVVTDTLEAVGRVDASATWVLSNHDVVRHATRYAAGATPERGLARARAATLTMLALPGSAYLYQGEELGLPEVDVAPEDRTDPSWFRTGEVGRDGCRVPIPWEGDEPPYGFGPVAPGSQPWLPQPEEWAGLSVAAQQADEDSTLAFYRRALAARREVLPGVPREVSVETHDDVLTLRRGDLVCHLNCGDSAVEPPAGEVVVCSGPTPGSPDTATWVRTG
ncbi:glycoside hydrolase family 13 protein [uncultured Nocardioides sp.]|uniref:glycoside hydrolase family 13 protein n=1 Tax=uncultured Nocardioides sp. TaxID=198441 RepID=UPI00260BA96E|nr:glycoside hydrolase family 13 protein [uncultured Nocardioides sp.]